MSQLQKNVVEILKTVYDPEIPINIWDLGLIYGVTENSGNVGIIYTLTSPNCPAAELIPEQILTAVESLEGVNQVKLVLTWEPIWDRSMMSEEARLELGM